MSFAGLSLILSVRMCHLDATHLDATHLDAMKVLTFCVVLRRGILQQWIEDNGSSGNRC